MSLLSERKKELELRIDKCRLYKKRHCVECVEDKQSIKEIRALAPTINEITQDKKEGLLIYYDFVIKDCPQEYKNGFCDMFREAMRVFTETEKELTEGVEK